MLLSYFKPIEGRKDAWCLADNHPEWLHEAIRAAHGTDLPNDWIYSVCRDVCGAIDDGVFMDDEDAAWEWADSQVDVYTRRLYQWAADMSLTDCFAYASEEANDFMSSNEDITKRIGTIQFCAIYNIVKTLVDCKQR